MSQKLQYQHYVPQFVLRKFSTYVEPNRATFTDNKTYTKAQKRAKEKAKVKAIEFSGGYANGMLDDRLCHKVFGMHEMYDAEIEKALSCLEQEASKIIKSIETDFKAGTESTCLKRADKDVLRKFIFIMGYRGRGFHRRFPTDENDYTTIDRPALLDYMHRNGFKTPKDVWLSNINAFIKVDMSKGHKSWATWLQQNAFPADALWFEKNMTTSYLCFCTPAESREEFILTQNAYGIYEGPNSTSAWMDWHTFTPINDKLLIVHRNMWLDDADSLASQMSIEYAHQIGQSFARGRDMIISHYKDSNQAQSWLKDMPVKRPSTRYSCFQFAAEYHPRKAIFNQDDNFTFNFFKLPSTYVQRINAIFLEQAVLTDSIVYRSEEALRNALEFYLDIEKPGFKAVIDREFEESYEIWNLDYAGIHSSNDTPEYSKRDYLEMLARIAGELGSSCSARCSIVTPRTCVVKPAMTAKFLDRYTALGFDNTVAGWVKDEEQGRLISKMWVCINEITRSTEKVARQAALRQRYFYVYRLPPHRVWLHLRMMRLFVDRQNFLQTANRGTYTLELVSAKNDGPEDIVADYQSFFAPECLSRAMMRASAMSQWIELNTTGPRKDWQESYSVAAWSFVGSITDCDMPVLKEAALKFRQQFDLVWWKRTAIERGYPEQLPLDMRIREYLFDNFESLVAMLKLARQDAHRLKMFVFRDLYPSCTRPVIS